MENSTETLLVILIIVLSTLAIIAMAAVIALLVAVRRIITKIELVADAATETVAMFKNRMIKKAGLFVTLKNLPKLFKRRKK